MTSPILSFALDYTEWKSEVTTKDLVHFFQMSKGRYQLIAIDGILTFTHLLDQDDVTDYEANYKDAANKNSRNFHSREPFASKTLSDGSKLFRRKHGTKTTVSANSEVDIILTVPYTKAKINSIEIINCNILDRVDLKVKSPIDEALAAAYGMPTDYMLNQFGENIYMTEKYYHDISEYDANVLQGLQIVLTYKNDTDTDTNIGINIVYHELV